MKHKHSEPAKAEKPPADRSDGPKEHFEAIRYLIGQMQAERQSDATRAGLGKVVERLDVLEGKKDAKAA
jgi:hypothetical protein